MCARHCSCHLNQRNVQNYSEVIKNIRVTSKIAKFIFHSIFTRFSPVLLLYLVDSICVCKGVMGHNGNVLLNILPKQNTETEFLFPGDETTAHIHYCLIKSTHTNEYRTSFKAKKYDWSK